MLTITSVDGDADARAVVACEDITERKRGEMLLAVQYCVARNLAGAHSAPAAVTTVIRTVCESLDWDCGRFFRFDPASEVLRFEEAWGVATTAVEQFLAKSRGMLIRPGAGLKGRVYLSGQPLWLVHGAAGTKVSSMALAPETEGNAAFVIPVTIHDRTIGVLAFSNREFSDPDDRMLETARSVGSQLGQFLERQEAVDKLRRSEARFRKATELSSDWYWEQDSSFRFTQFVGCGITGVEQYLGKTHWELASIQLSDAQWAEHRSHLAAHWSFCDFEFAAKHPDGQLGYYCISGEPVYDDAGAFTGYCGTGLDISVRKRASEARLLAQVS
jgi:PAS domain S-box-containing protein